MTGQHYLLIAATLLLLVSLSACASPNGSTAMPSILVTPPATTALPPDQQASSVQTDQEGDLLGNPSEDLIPLVTDLGLVDMRLAVLHPLLLFRQWEIRDPGDVMGTGSLYFIDPAAFMDPAIEGSRDELNITVLANPAMFDLNEWVKVRQEPVDAAGWEQLPLGPVTYRPASSIESITVRGHKAVMFLDHSWDLVAGRVLIDDGDRIISLVYTDHGDGAMKPVFSTVVASLDWTRSPQEGFGRNLAVDQALKQQLDEILAGYLSTR